MKIYNDIYQGFDADTSKIYEVFLSWERIINDNIMVKAHSKKEAEQYVIDHITVYDLDTYTYNDDEESLIIREIVCQDMEDEELEEEQTYTNKNQLALEV